ncbi:heparinase II/III family protein [Microbacterium sp. MYb62]|uniref:heparinase II/III domain-containing protein n=1 Tax=Microbacterium sp. MYb62 TaxID=1848690 RepID=UPI0011B0EE21|nr:heparinase II/III family protein [Microbacterium sp. MYb62]
MLIPRGAVREIWEQSAAAAPPPLVPSSRDRAVWDALDPDLRSFILTAADGALGLPWPQPLLSQWAAYARTGDRAAYEASVFARDRRLRTAVLAAALEPSPARLTEAADGLALLCEQSTWCWPAHDDAFARGLRVPDVDRPFVDLGAGEEAALAAWSVLILGEALDEVAPGLLARLRRETQQRVLEPFARRRDWAWEGTEDHVHNWAPWIHGNLIPAALAFTDGAARAEVLELCVDGLDRYLAQLPADGAIDEGFAYWWQGAARAFDALALLDVLTAGQVSAAVDGGSLAGLRELARFPERMQLGDGWTVSFSDAEARLEAGTPWHALFRAARLCRLPETAAFAARHREDGVLCGARADVSAGLGRMTTELLDRSWQEAERGSAPLPSSAELPSIGFGLRREQAGTTAGLTVAVKGGHNAENHNHNDLGSFAVAVDGVPLLADLGRATYTAQTFSDTRYDLWYVTSGWHSTPLPSGREQLPGREWHAPVRVLDDGWRIDLSAAYPWPGEPESASASVSESASASESWIRTVRLVDGVVTVRDDGAAVGHPDTRIAVVCAGAPRRGADGIRIPGRDGSGDLLLTHDDAEVEIETRAVDDPYLERSWGRQVSRILFAPASGATTWEMRGALA